MTTRLALTVLLALLLTGAPSVLAQDGEPGKGSDEPNPLKNCYFGEQHLHTVNSPDAFAFGTRNTPDDAYKFAKGIAIRKSTTGVQVKEPVTALQAMRTGMQPAAPPHTMFWSVRRFSNMVYPTA